MIDLQDAVVVITGASSGLGRRFAIDLAAAGAIVTGLARREQLLASVAEEVHRTSATPTGTRRSSRASSANAAASTY
jgi:NADP-dependent 3-hydroxy acid dehydrogenase YdfG